MRRLLTWFVVTLGIAAILRRLKRRRAAADELEPAPRPPEDDPADELRRKLAETRPTEEAPAEPVVSESPVEERRSEVHEQGRSTLDEMREPDES
jgi:hypothetical protein